MKHLISFLKNPCNREEAQVSWLHLLSLYGVYFCGLFPIGFTIAILQIWLGFSYNFVEDWNLQQKLLIAVLFAPVVEEFAFRYLVKFRIQNYLVFILGASLIAFLYLIQGKFAIPVVLLGVSVIGAVLMLLGTEVVERNFKWIYYFSSFSFGLLHIFNFHEMKVIYYLLTPLLVAPQIWAGSILGYIRVRYGFLYAIIFHMFINVTACFW